MDQQPYLGEQGVRIQNAQDEANTLFKEALSMATKMEGKENMDMSHHIISKLLSNLSCHTRQDFEFEGFVLIKKAPSRFKKYSRNGLLIGSGAMF